MLEYSVTLSKTYEMEAFDVLDAIRMARRDFKKDLENKSVDPELVDYEINFTILGVQDERPLVKTFSNRLPYKTPPEKEGS